MSIWRAACVVIGVVVVITACGDAADHTATDAGGRLDATTDLSVADLAEPTDVSDASGTGDSAVSGSDASPDGDQPDAFDLDARDGDSWLSPDAVGQDVAADVTDVGWDPDGEPPTVTITVNEIPPEMNGSVPYLGPDQPETEFTLRLPTWRFTVDVYGEPAVDGAPIDWSTLSVSATSTDLDSEVWRPALGELFEIDENHARWQVQEGAAFEPARWTFEARMSDIAGRESALDELTVDIVPLPAHLDPFTEPDEWLVTFSRDAFALTLSYEQDAFRLDAEEVAGGNGIPDFDEAMTVLGLFSSNPEATAFVREELLGLVRKSMHGLFVLSEDGSIHADSVPIVLWFEGDDGAPDPGDFAGGGFSMIAVGGDGDAWDVENRIVGRALLDPNNQSFEDNTTVGRGVFTNQMVRLVLTNPAAALFLRQISPLTGTPIGEHPDDGLFLVDDLDPSTLPPGAARTRQAVYAPVRDFLAFYVGFTLCHEMGHSLGLVPQGPPPEGLFGGMSGLPFVDKDTSGWHIDTAGMNVMQTGQITSWIEAVAMNGRFNALNLAFLRRRLVVGHLDVRDVRRGHLPVDVPFRLPPAPALPQPLWGALVR